MNIKSICDLKGIGFKELSEKTGISRSHLSCIQNGLKKPSFDTLRKLKVALDVSYDVLLKE